jgi:hypothetical protein
MTDTAILQPLVGELDRWHAAGKTARFWLRDDDAVEPTAELARLLELTTRHGLPVTIAVIPLHTGQALADYLAPFPGVTVVVHGWSHANHAGPDEKKQELGTHRPGETVLDELDAGFHRLRALHPARFIPLLVPPWNRIAPGIVAELPKLGFRAMSAFGPEKPAPLAVVNTHVDLMDWHGTRGARQPAALVADMVKRLQEIWPGDGALGFLTHHLVHDEAGWSFLDQMFSVTRRHPACRWIALADMLE